MANLVSPSLQKAGSVHIRDLKLISSNNTVVDLNEFLIELNVYEDIFSQYMYGDIVISDSRNLIELMPIVGEEFLNVEFFTPTFEESKQIIKKTFRVFKLSDRRIIRDNNTQTYVLHFASIELFYDINLPLYKSFSGKISELVENIYFDYLAASRDFLISNNQTELKDSEKYTPLTIIDETSNSAKFVAPGWSPFKCINWLASKSISEKGNGKSFLFFESNKSYYFGSLDAIFRDSTENKNIVGVYSYSPNNIKQDKSRDIVKEFFTVSDMQMVETTDHVKNYTSGYLANRLIHLDIYNKVYDRVDYDYVEDYKNNYHTSGSGDKAIPVFTSDSPRNSASSVSFYPKNPKLYDDFPGNVNEKMNEIYGNRKSTLLGLTNIKLNITVPGRTDVEVGNLIYFKFPALAPVSYEDKNKENIDKNYSGYYLITAIHHRVTFQEHVMIMEIVKDSLRTEL